MVQRHPHVRHRVSAVATAAMAMLLCSGIGCSRPAVDDEPDELRERCVFINGFGLDEDGRHLIDDADGGSIWACLCASEDDLEDHDVADAVADAAAQTCERRGRELGYEATTCEAAADANRDPSRLHNGDRCESSAFDE